MRRVKAVCMPLLWPIFQAWHSKEHDNLRSYTGGYHFFFGKWERVCFFWFSFKIKGGILSGVSVRNTGTLCYLLRGQLWLSETWNTVFKSFNSLFTICVFCSQGGKPVTLLGRRVPFTFVLVDGTLCFSCLAALLGCGLCWAQQKHLEEPCS